MRIFDHFPKVATCPVCGTSKDDKCILVPIQGTQDGGNIEAQPVHVQCILEDAIFVKEYNMICIDALK